MTKLRTNSKFDFVPKSRRKSEYVARELCDFNSKTKVSSYFDFESDFST